MAWCFTAKSKKGRLNLSLRDLKSAERRKIFIFLSKSVVIQKELNFPPGNQMSAFSYNFLSKKLFHPLKYYEITVERGLGIKSFLVFFMSLCFNKIFKCITCITCYYLSTTLLEVLL